MAVHYKHFFIESVLAYVITIYGKCTGSKIQSKFYGWLVYAAFFMRGPEFDSHGKPQIHC